MIIRRSITAAGLFLIATGTIYAQNFSNRPVRIVAGEAGGNADVTARLVAQGLTASLGQAVIVDNRPDGVIAFEIVRKAAPDGHTLLIYNNGFWLGPLFQKSAYDPVNEFVPVTLITISPSILVVYPSVAAKSVSELIALAKSKPGELNFASTGSGSGSRLAGELFKSMAGVNIVHVPYRGNALALNDLIAGRVQLMFPPAATVTQHMNAGRLRGLAVTTAKPFALFPNLPTVAASGLPNYEMVSRTGIFAPAKTPAAAIHRLNQDIGQFLKTPEVKSKLLTMGVEAAGSTPQEFAAMIKMEIAEFTKVIKAAGIKPE